MTRSKQSSRSIRASSDDHEKNFNEDDRKQLYEINDIVKTMVEEIKMLKTQLERSNSKVKRLEIENAQLKQTANLTLYKLDSLERYGRRENLKIHNVPENKETICKVVIFRELTDWAKRDLTRRNHARSIIVRFVSYKKRNEILFAKSKLKNSQEFSNAFISEDLTPLRSKLL